MNLPDKFLRGIPNKDFLDKEGYPTSSLFYFGQKNLSIRDDGFNEESINWFDDDGVIQFTLDQKKEDGSFQFKIGATILLKSEIELINTKPYVNNALKYERDMLTENKYHGNLLLKNDVPKALMMRIAAAIAISVIDIVKR